MITDSQPSVLEEHVKAYMSNYDCSHDWLHVERVRRMARKLALEESRTRSVDLRLVDLAALLHDVGDAKYCRPEESAKEALSKLLTDHGVAADVIERVCLIVENVSFRAELKHLENDSMSVYADNIELCCVQDADRLDAIGAIGIARCFAFSGSRNIPIYDDSKPLLPALSAQAYNQQTAKLDGTALNHFYEKLLLLEGMMKTGAGRAIAKQRADFTKSFVAQIKSECEIDWTV